MLNASTSANSTYPQDLPGSIGSWRTGDSLPGFLILGKSGEGQDLSGSNGGCGQGLSGSNRFRINGILGLIAGIFLGGFSGIFNLLQIVVLEHPVVTYGSDLFTRRDDRLFLFKLGNLVHDLVAFIDRICIG
jgi:hypothetical protein